MVMLYSRAVNDEVEAGSVNGGCGVARVQYEGGVESCLGPVVGSLIGLEPRSVFRNVVASCECVGAGRVNLESNAFLVCV